MTAKSRPRAWVVMVALLVAACGAGPSPTPSSSTTSGGPAGTPALTPGPSGGVIGPVGPADLSARPLAWFAPLPPLPTGPGRPFTGSDDFTSLFSPGAAWDRAAAHVQVFKLYGEWVAYDASADDLRAAVEAIAARGMVLAVEMGPLSASETCGSGVESFAGIDEGHRISQRIRDAGGTLQVIALDEPYYFGHVFDGANACRWTPDQVASGVAQFVAAMRVDWPDLLVGDTEPMPDPVSADDLATWLHTYRTVVGEPPAFLHLDMDWSRSGWPAMASAVVSAGRAVGVPVGLIYTGGAAASDARWVAAAGSRILAFENASGPPDEIVFQSWDDKPDHVLPETEPTSFTALIDRYFDDHAALANVPGQPNNLALGRHVSASSSIAGSRPGGAVDGDADTLWSAGTGPPSWLQIDLGAVRQITGVQLQVSQTPAGSTRHRLTCASTAGGTRRVIADLHGVTSDLQVLTVRLESPTPCRYLRIETLASPSWIAWREVEVYGPA